MNVFSKILTALRGSAREIGESVIDQNATRIYEQEIHESRTAVTQAKSDLTRVMAQQKACEREIERLDKEIARYEEHAMAALDKDAEALATEVAGHIAALETERAEQQKAGADMASNVAQLKELIRSAEARIREHERELAVAKTTESVYRATESISTSLDGSASKLGNAKESLERIKRRHTEQADRMEAARELDAEFGHKAIDRKLAEAGIGENSQQHQADVLARLKARRETPKS
ncbi:PspA/IM30 family protein [Chitinibacteraceae bacterium HSL-7]